MSRAAIADRLRFSRFVAGRGLRRAAGRLGAWATLYRLWPARGAAERLLVAPQDLRTADPTRASEIYAGRFALAGKIVACDGRSPFDVLPPSQEWAETLHGFSWLRHLRAAESPITRANARALVEDWIARRSGRNPLAWRSDIVARRLMSWLSQTPLLLDDADPRFYRRLMRSLSRQGRILRRLMRQAPEGLPRLQCAIALTYVALCMSSQSRSLRRAIARLGDELRRQILPDGGHVSRNPGALIELLLDLLPLRQTFASRNLPSPPALNHAIERMMPMLRFFRHGDGAFAHFNGMGPTSPELLATVLAYDDTRGAPVANAPHSGYQRLQQGDAVVLVDTGQPPPLALSTEAHAGCLSFELSARRQRIVVNCGIPAKSREQWRQVARPTPAHSTVTLNDTSSCRFLTSSSLRRLVGSPIVAGPRQVPTEREDYDAEVALRASHDGYADRFGILHERTLRLFPEGRLEGEDRFLSAGGKTLPARVRDRFAIRFHLHPGVRATRLNDRNGVMLALSNRDTWLFMVEHEHVTLEDSVYLAGPDGPRGTRQIVIYGRAREVGEIRWSFALMEEPRARHW